jgi:hypothetical protein
VDHVDGWREVIEAPELRAGLVAGVAALVVCVLVVSELRRRAARSGSAPGLVGTAVVAATLAGLAGSSRVDGVGAAPVRVAIAVTLLWIAGEIGARVHPALGGLLALAGGAALVDRAARPEAWIVAVLVIGPAVGGVATAAFDRRAGRTGLGPRLLLVSILGLTACVPDTELALAFTGAMLPLVLLSWPRVVARLGSGGAYAAIGLFCWIATIDGAPRPGSIVGSVAALGLLVAEPLGRLLTSGRAHASRAPGDENVRVAALVGVQLVLVAYAARVAGRVDDAPVAMILAVPVLLVGLVVGARFGVEPDEPDR